MRPIAVMEAKSLSAPFREALGLDDTTWKDCLGYDDRSVRNGSIDFGLQNGKAVLKMSEIAN